MRDLGPLLHDVFGGVGFHTKNDRKIIERIFQMDSGERCVFIRRAGFFFDVLQLRGHVAVGMHGLESGLENKVKADKDFDANKLEWKLQIAIQQLPEKQRVVFTLRYYDEMPYEQMSKVLDTSEGALKASYHHAVKKIEDYILNH